MDVPMTQIQMASKYYWIFFESKAWWLPKGMKPEVAKVLRNFLWNKYYLCMYSFWLDSFSSYWWDLKIYFVYLECSSPNVFYYQLRDIFFSSSPWKLVIYVLEWMGLNVYEYDGLQPKTTPHKHFSRQCI